MLLELHVRNLALIEKADIEPGGGLTVLSGETGAGKSILVDSINVALGARTSKGIIRDGADQAGIELVFSVPEDKTEAVRKLGIPVEDDGLLIITRKITPLKSIARVNDETVTASVLRSLTGLLMDMHGQFEHQTLLYPANHLAYIDRMCPKHAAGIKQQIRSLWQQYEEIINTLSENTDPEMRKREADILRYEIEEIEKAGLRAGEDEELETVFRRMKNASRITSYLSDAQRNLDSECISYAARNLSEAYALDSGLKDLKDQLDELDDLLTDARRAIGDYAESLDFDAEGFDRVEKRLDEIHNLQGKYGDDIETILHIAKEKKNRLESLEQYDAQRKELEIRKAGLETELEDLCGELSAIRKETAAELVPEIRKHLQDLNFLGARFEIEFRRETSFSQNGCDSVQFMISTNPGQSLRPLKDVASGGELSRIMLALKTVLADSDDIDTMIFDEIDAGISGRTAQAVAEKLHVIAKGRQVICITHLPQIAAMADNHYLIAKSTDGCSTRTDITLIEGEAVTAELARMIGGSEITGTVEDAAREMKKLADKVKEG